MRLQTRHFWKVQHDEKPAENSRKVALRRASTLQKKLPAALAFGVSARLPHLQLECPLFARFLPEKLARVGALFYLFVAALDIDLRVERVNTDANMANLPSRPLSGRGELSKMTPLLADCPMIFISKTEFDDPALFFKKWRE